MTDNLNAKLAAIQQKLCVPKTRVCKGGAGYKYRNCDDIMEAVKPLLGDTTLVLSDEIVAVGDRIYVKATATFTDGNGSVITNHAFAREASDPKGMSMAQLTGATSSYARKYALAGLFCLDDEQDDDVDAGERSKSKPAKVEAKQETKPAAQPAPKADHEAKNDPVFGMTTLDRKVYNVTLGRWVQKYTEGLVDAAKKNQLDKFIELNMSNVNLLIQYMREMEARLNGAIETVKMGAV